MTYELFNVGHDVVGGSARFFVRRGEKEAEKWRGNGTPIVFVKPERTIWDELRGRSYVRDCMDANAKVQAWCDWANKELENDEKLKTELDNMFGRT